MTDLKFILKLSSILFMVFICSSCENDLTFTPNQNPLEFSKDTVFLDTVFTNIGSSTYSLKVYNNSNNNIVIPEIKLQNTNESFFRINIDGIYENDGQNTYENIELLANDSLYVFIETTIDINQIGTEQNSFIYEDKLQFINVNNTQNVHLVSLVKDAVFIFPNRELSGQDYIYETLSFDLDGDGIADETNIRGRFLDQDELVFNNDKPYVIYGYAAVSSGDELLIEKGSRIYFHSNSGFIITSGASLKANGEFSENQNELENEIIFEGDRLEPFFENIPGQWGTIWLMDGSVDNELSFCTIKNSTVGLYSSGGDTNSTYKLKLSNVKIFNSSNFGILGISTSIKAENLVINNSGQSSFAGTYGGKYNLNHSTISNYWNNGIRQFPSLLVNDFYVDSNQNEYTNNLFEVNITNSIIYGNQNIEFLVEKIGSDEMELNVANSLIKFNDYNNYFENDINLDFSNQNYYEEIYENLDPSFINEYQNDLRINQFSEVIGLGKEEFALETPLDMLNIDRTLGPDVGAYQHTIVQD